ncbi:MAG: glycosyltransferase [Acidimicrobiia bacterium]|nr:glycosyltransferase [Acidimicrobiia bacterium]
MTEGIGVAIAAYRAGTVLGACLGTIAGQTSPAAQVVVVDDGSGDDTSDVARRWASILPLQVVVLKSNSGVATALHRAVEATDTELVALIGADDMWLPDHLETLSRVHRERGGIAMADAYRWEEGKGIRPRTFSSYHPVPNPSEQPAAILRENFVFVGSVFERTAYDRVGGFRAEHTGAEDWDLWIRMIRAGERVHSADRPTAIYRLSPGGMTRDERIRAAYLRMLEEARADAATDAERSAASDTIRWLRARSHLGLAHAAARRGDNAEARREARLARGGGPKVTLEAAALRVAPNLGLRLGERLRARYW